VQSVTHVKIALFEAHKPFLGCSFSNRVFSVDGTNVGLCSFGASIELIKKNVLEVFIFLNLALYSFGPENFVPLVKIGKFQNGLIEENENYIIVYYTHSQQSVLVGKKLSKTKTSQTYAPTQYV
jgi:hypothetical protein